MTETDGHLGTATMPGLLSQVGMQYSAKYPAATFELYARISAKNHTNSALNPLAMYQREFTVEEIMNDKMIAYPNTRAMCSANTDGAAAAVLVSEKYLSTLSAGQRKRAVRVAASVLTSDPWTNDCQVLPDMNTLTRNAAEIAYERAGIGPDDLDLVELHDCFATAELLHYENLMLCPVGGAVDFLIRAHRFEGAANPSTSREAWSRRATRSRRPESRTCGRSANTCETKQESAKLTGATVGLAHVFGLGSSAAVHILTK